MLFHTTGLCLLPLLAACCRAQFIVVALGPYGGIEGGATTAFLLGRQKPDPYFVSLDAGTLVSGAIATLQREEAQCGRAPPWLPSGPASIHDRALAFISDRVEGAVVTHAHLDHTAGLVMASPNLKHKLLVGGSTTLNGIRDNLFNNVIWPDLAYPSSTSYGAASPLAPFILSAGEASAAWLYRPLEINGQQNFRFNQSELSVLWAWNVSHTEPAAAFLLGDSLSGPAVLFFGDNGPGGTLGGGTEASWKANTQRVFEQACAALSAAGGRLAVIMLEVSYPLGRSESSLYGHTTPDLVAQALRDACSTCGGLLSLTHFIIIHSKPVFGSTSAFNASGAAAVELAMSEGVSAPQLIAQQLWEQTSGVRRPVCFAPDFPNGWVHAPLEGEILYLSDSALTSTTEKCSSDSSDEMLVAILVLVGTVGCSFVLVMLSRIVF